MANLLNTSASMMCPHGGSVSAISNNSKAKAGGSYILRASDTFIISGCPLVIANSPHPCIQVQWLQPGLKSKAMGDFTLNNQSVGLCVAADQAAQGTVLINFTQSQVAGI